MTKIWNGKFQGFALIELLVVIAGLGIISSIGYISATGGQAAARENKLTSDVRTINSSIQLYLASGGDLDGVSDASGVLEKLKSRATVDAADRRIGLAGNFLDLRVEGVPADATSGPRAVWNASGQRFEVADSGAGFAKFEFNEAATAVAPEDRANIKDSQAAGWVWEYAATTPQDTRTGIVPATGVAAGGGPTPSPSPSPGSSPTPTPVPTPVPSPSPPPVTGGGGSALPSGVLIGSGEFQNSALFQGNITVIETDEMADMIINGTARLSGNLYLPGTPDIIFERQTGGWETWSAATDAASGANILGGQFDESGYPVDPPDSGWSPSPRVIDLDGDVLPNDYEVRMQRGVRIDGKIFRRAAPAQFPTVDPPTPKNNTVSRQYDSWTLSPSNPNRFTTTVNPNVSANVALRTQATLTVLPGAFGAVSASNNGTLVLGNAANPDEVSYYSFESLTINGGASVQIVGRVEITMGSAFRIDNNGTMGNKDHPEWLKMSIYNPNPPANVAQFNVFSTAAFYGQVVAPKGIARLDNGAKFTGSITAYRMQMFSESGTDVRFTLSPIAAEPPEG